MTILYIEVGGGVRKTWHHLITLKVVLPSAWATYSPLISHHTMESQQLLEVRWHDQI